MNSCAFVCHHFHVSEQWKDPLRQLLLRGNLPFIIHQLNTLICCKEVDSDWKMC